MKRDWVALFEELKTLGRFRSDAQLAEYLGVTRAQISAWRNGKSDLGTITKLRILNALGHDDLGSALASLLADLPTSENGGPSGIPVTKRRARSGKKVIRH